MKLFHTSPKEIKKIDRFGIAGDCLFFSSNVYTMTSSSNCIVYSIEIDESKVVSVGQLHDEAIIAEIAEEFGIDEDAAESLLDGSESEWSYDCDAEKSWWLQGKQGECAKKMGFDAVESEDEQGAVWIVSMMGREGLLNVEQN